MFVGQGDKTSILELLMLHKHQVPELDKVLGQVVIGWFDLLT